ncbi:MAG TPA: hypothetical protein VGR85_14625 [Candidatus Limnocylindria bacterium]|nr:hypothetical protein [Candidatus Limnocylindria bacterium]
MKEKARKSKREPTAQQEDTRPIDDPARLADEARATVEKNATELRKQRVPIATEPPTVFRP